MLERRVNGCFLVGCMALLIAVLALAAQLAGGGYGSAQDRRSGICHRRQFRLLRRHHCHARESTARPESHYKVRRESDGREFWAFDFEISEAE